MTLTLGLRRRATVQKGSTIMPPIAPLSVDLAHNVLYAVDPKDADGNATSPSLLWASSDSAIMTVTPSPDGKQCFAETVAAGVATVSVSGDGIVDSQDVTVTAVEPPPPGPTVALNLSAQVVPKA